jgi:hypothetical protein
MQYRLHYFLTITSGLGLLKWGHIGIVGIEEKK